MEKPIARVCGLDATKALRRRRVKEVRVGGVSTGLLLASWSCHLPLATFGRDPVARSHTEEMSKHRQGPVPGWGWQQAGPAVSVERSLMGKNSNS